MANIHRDEFQQKHRLQKLLQFGLLRQNVKEDVFLNCFEKVDF
jgi:hypothetical protein